MSITAVCIFPKKEKSFWLNTGSEMIYANVKEDDDVLSFSSKKKKLATVKAQSIFSSVRDYSSKAEGSVFEKPRTFWIVSSEVSDFFEEYMTKRDDTIFRKEIIDFSYCRKKPIIIGKINGD